MIRYLGVVAAMYLALVGCATPPDLNKERLESLPQHYSQFDVDIAWQVRNLGSHAVVDGELKSLRYQFMENIEIWVAVLDAEGRSFARSVSFVSPHEVKAGEVVPFSLKLPVSVGPGTRLRFTYNYSGSDGGDSKGDYRTQSFETRVPLQ